MKIGFFGGTFDPIHFGHIHFALELKEALSLDLVLFCPANLSPGKDKPIASCQDRLEMVRLAIEEIPFFKVCDYEIQKEGPSFTIDTIRHLKKEKAGDYFLLLADEVASSFEKWKEYEALMKLTTPVIGKRDPKAVIPSFLKEHEIKTSFFEISSTAIRRRLGKGLYCGHLVPPKVLAYIKERSLY